MLPNWRGLPLLSFFGRFPIYGKAVKFWRPPLDANFFHFFNQLETERQKSKKGWFWKFPTIGTFTGSGRSLWQNIPVDNPIKSCYNYRVKKRY